MENDTALLYAHAFMEHVVPSTLPDLPPEMVVQQIETALSCLDEALEIIKVMLNARCELQVAKMARRASNSIGTPNGTLLPYELPRIPNETATCQPSSPTGSNPQPGTPSTDGGHAAGAPAAGPLENEERPQHDPKSGWTTVRRRYKGDRHRVRNGQSPRPVSSTPARNDARSGGNGGVRKAAHDVSQARTQFKPAPPGFMRGAAIYNTYESLSHPSTTRARGSATTARKGDLWVTVSYQKSRRALD
ncbi:hypothetical protein C8T65DRAFT_662168 [Cerioporus squamosus]|nr:hypothetical protein C8T65DRAFT_662168 [Cerioporus squamosus]